MRRNDPVREGNQGETTQGEKGIGAKRPGANGNRGETTQGANGIRGETTRYPSFAIPKHMDSLISTD